jgi:hypothetical protein
MFRNGISFVSLIVFLECAGLRALWVVSEPGTVATGSKRYLSW